MLNGAAMKLRKAHARIATLRTKRTVLHEPSRFFGSRSGAALGSARRMTGGDIAAVVSGAGLQVKAGWHLRARLLLACSHADPKPAGPRTDARRAVQGGAGPAQPPQLRSGRPVFRLVQDASPAGPLRP